MTQINRFPPLKWEKWVELKLVPSQALPIMDAGEMEIEIRSLSLLQILQLNLLWCKRSLKFRQCSSITHMFHELFEVLLQCKKFSN